MGADGETLGLGGGGGCVADAKSTKNEGVEGRRVREEGSPREATEEERDKCRKGHPGKESRSTSGFGGTWGTQGVSQECEMQGGRRWEGD